MSERPAAATPGEGDEHDGKAPEPGSRRGQSLRETLSGAVGVGAAAAAGERASAATGGSYTATSDGAWSDPDTWDEGSLPDDDSEVYVQDGVTVTVASELTARVRFVEVSGELVFDPTVDTRLRVETLWTNPGSRLEIGTSSSPVQAGNTATVEILDQGAIDEEKWSDRENKGILAEGALEIAGREKTPHVTLSRAAEAGDTTLELASEPTNWAAGDDLVVPGLEPYFSTDLSDKDEERTISSISGTTVELDAALEYDHVPPTSDLDTYVLNLERNVVVRSENTDEKRRGHIMVMDAGSDVRNVRLVDLGRTKKDEYLTNPPRNGDQVSADDPNTRARYSFHYHKTGIDAAQHYAKGLVVDGNIGWGVVNHHANALVEDSITYRTLGAGFVTEGGNERGTFRNCFALRSTGSGEPIDSRAAGDHGGDPPIDDLGHAGHGFWMQSPVVDVVDCVAAGHRHQAFVWWLRPLLDGPMAECTTVEDSRVTLCPNLPVEYDDTSRPLWEAIQQDRFFNGTNNDLMRETGKIPSCFADLGTVSGNVAFGSAGGVDFSRHNFKWIHERFSDFNTLDDFTIFTIGPFIDGDGTKQEPDLPKHRASGPTQGRGGSTGVSFRYSSNVSLANSYVRGIDRDDSVGVPYHDYRWSVTVEDCTVENWDWGVASGEHSVTWVRGCTLSGNDYDAAWTFDNVGPMLIDDTTFDTLFRDFSRRNQKAPEVLYFGRTHGLRVDGRTAYPVEMAPDHVLFPDTDSLDGINNIEKYIDSVDDETNLVGLTNREMKEQYGICVGGELLPEDTVSEPWTSEAVFDPEVRDPPTDAVTLDATDAERLGAFEVASAQDVAGGEALRCTGSSSPTDDAASIPFACESGTYRMHVRVRPDAWNGDTVSVRVDGGTWKPVEKIRSPAGFGWHVAAPNGGDPHEWRLSAGTHTLEVACGNDDVYVDEVFLGATDDAQVVGGYGTSQGLSVSADGDAVDSGGTADLAIRGSGLHEFVVSGLWTDWEVDDSQVDGTVTDRIAEAGELVITYDSVQDSVSPTLPVSLPSRYVGGTYRVWVTATDDSAAAVATATITV